MAKNVKGKAVMPPTVTEYRPPSPGRMIRMGAENAARMSMDAHPKIKAMRNALTDAIHGAIKAHLGPMRKGRFN